MPVAMLTALFVGMVIVLYLNSQEIQAVFRQRLSAKKPNLTEGHT
jgi:hypothetical protein